MHSRKIILFLLIAVFSLLSEPYTVRAAEVTINASNLNVRSGPGTDYESIGRVDTGQTFSVIEQEDDWVEIKLENETGWIKLEFVTLSESQSNETEEEESEVDSDMDSIVIQQDNTQLRDGPSTDYAIVHFAEKDTEMEVIASTNNWYEVANDEITGFVLKRLVEPKKNTSNSNVWKDKTIVIDAGHGGRDVGAIGASETYEKDIAYLTAHELEQELLALGANVLLTREEDEFISLASRITYSNIVDTDAFLSIHYNSIPEFPDVSGIETYYYADYAEKLAENIQQGIIEETGDRDRGAHEGDLFVIRHNLKPSVLLELGFISNPEKEAQLQTQVYQQQLVHGILQGLAKNFVE
ncbi:N-acetylmuramoyl-L-alanine amidase [Oceanobacillus polygoni]|uniref:N-acetylmuramoyl-L-alanine amidase n=1 Tax=Oceanobacillus polygoni TaxID=1235259 RepID=A0A9X0YUZ4_9BACI|nr:N-acetylmuramoyl-L-alanine amidase [Oceanobacillus polygoni]MBP2077476.1 N-acetylmuramoyl-L-alanine amidase [Oceanobacillus polygoni]